MSTDPLALDTVTVMLGLGVDDHPHDNYPDIQGQHLLCLFSLLLFNAS
ncbi:MAG: hypothetical protein PHS56_05280 [Eubacteriales bacterium]|nr:hypothetical protein [Eubacteriales bacterium]